MTKNKRRYYGFLMKWLKNVETTKPKNAGERWVRNYNKQEVGGRLNELLQLKLKPLKNPKTSAKINKTSPHKAM